MKLTIYILSLLLFSLAHSTPNYYEEEINKDTWRLVEIEHIELNNLNQEKTLKSQLLRPLWWIDENIKDNEINFHISELNVCRFKAKVLSIKAIPETNTLHPELSEKTTMPVIGIFRYLVIRVDYHPKQQILMPWNIYSIPINSPKLYIENDGKILYRYSIADDHEIYLAHQYIDHVESIEIMQMHYKCRFLPIIENDVRYYSSRGSDEYNQDYLSQCRPEEEQNNNVSIGTLLEIPQDELMPYNIGDDCLSKQDVTKCCHQCNKEFVSSSNLKRHKRIHAGKKSYCCNYCYKSFTRSDHLRTHTRTHTGEKPYKCNQCIKAFARPDELSRHKRIHQKTSI